MSEKKLFDQKCLDLANYFLWDPHHATDPNKARELASAIQYAVEDWIKAQERADE